MARHEFDELTAFARALVLRKVTILAGLATVLPILVTLGLPVTWTARITAAVTAGIVLLGAIVGALAAQKVVTPADLALNPTSSEGVALVPETTNTVAVAQAILAAQAAPDPSAVGSATSSEPDDISDLTSPESVAVAEPGADPLVL